MSRCLAFLLFGLILLVSGTAEGADPRRFCSGTAANVVLYVDVTSPYDERDRQTLMDGVSTIVAGFTGGERLSVRTIADEFARSDRLLDLCMPYCPSNGFFADLVSDCTEGIVINESKHMRAAIAAGINRAMSAARDLPHSEIVRTIAMSASEEYRDGRANRIYIFSDMIENSEFMPGRTFLTTKNEKLIDGLADDKLIPNLDQADIRIFGVGRGGDPAERKSLDQAKLDKVTAFWLLFFKASGAMPTMQQNLSAD